MSNLNFEKKYLKYKNKYINLYKSLNNKNTNIQLGGSSLSFISREDFNKRFLSEEFLSQNPDGLLLV
jgi:hypothetical protein